MLEQDRSLNMNWMFAKQKTVPTLKYTENDL